MVTDHRPATIAATRKVKGGVDDAAFWIGFYRYF
jgi:hypothetical protein